jgi:hypothetical protein
MAVGALGSIVLALGLPPEILPPWFSIAFWICSWLILWLLAQLSVRFTAGFMPEEKVIKFLHEGTQPSE